MLAWIQLKPGETATEEEIRDFCRGKIAYFKIPQYHAVRGWLSHDGDQEGAEVSDPRAGDSGARARKTWRARRRRKATAIASGRIGATRGTANLHGGGDESRTAIRYPAPVLPDSGTRSIWMPLSTRRWTWTGIVGDGGTFERNRVAAGGEDVAFAEPAGGGKAGTRTPCLVDEAASVLVIPLDPVRSRTTSPRRRAHRRCFQLRRRDLEILGQRSAAPATSISTPRRRMGATVSTEYFFSPPP